MKNPYTTEIPYMVEHIEQRAEKLYNTYRNKHPHNTPALNVQQLTYDLGGKIWLNPDVNRLLNTAELDINDYTLNPETQQWENINFNSYIPYLTLHEQKNRNHRKRIHQVPSSPQPRTPIPTHPQQQNRHPTRQPHQNTALTARTRSKQVRRRPQIPQHHTRRTR